MKKFIILVIGLCIGAVLIGAFQEPALINRIVSKVNVEGIMYPDASYAYVFFDDFFNYDSTTFGSRWIHTINRNGSTAAAITVGDVIGGNLVIATSDSSHTYSSGVNLQARYENFKTDTAVGARKELTFEARVKIDSVHKARLLCGLIKRDTKADTCTDAVYFMKDVYSDSIKCITVKNGAVGSLTGDTTVVANAIVDGTFLKLKIYFSGYSSVQYFINDRIVASHTTKAYFPNDEELTPTFGVYNNYNEARTAYIDYIFAKQKR